MKVDYSLIPNDGVHRLFRDSPFQRVVHERIHGTPSPKDRDLRVYLDKLGGNPDAISMCCRDEKKHRVPGTPSAGECVLSKSSYEDYEPANVNGSVARELQTLDEFLARVQQALGGQQGQ